MNLHKFAPPPQPQAQVTTTTRAAAAWSTTMTLSQVGNVVYLIFGAYNIYTAYTTYLLRRCPKLKQNPFLGDWTHQERAKPRITTIAGSQIEQAGRAARPPTIVRNECVQRREGSRFQNANFASNSCNQAMQQQPFHPSHLGLSIVIKEKAFR